MIKDFLKQVLKKGFDVGLEEEPIGKEAFLLAIENYCIKENLNYKFIEKYKPAVISIGNIVYDCKLIHAGRAGWCLHFKEQ